MGEPTVSFVVDSTSDLVPEWRDAHGITVVPLRVIFGEQELRDGFDMTPVQFYERMASGETEHPRTSQPTPAEFEKAFRAAGKAGRPIICTTISSEISGTWNSATAARDALTNLDIRLIDTRTLAAAHNAIVRAGVTVSEAGGSPDAVVAAIEEVKTTGRLVFTVETLEHLRRGGRISSPQALAGSVLNIKPILEMKDGRIETIDKVRTYARALDRLVEEVREQTERWETRATCLVAHAARPDHGVALAKQLAPYADGEVVIIPVGPVIGCHGGPGCIGISFHRPLRPFG